MSRGRLPHTPRRRPAAPVAVVLAAGGLLVGTGCSGPHGSWAPTGQAPRSSAVAPSRAVIGAGPTTAPAAATAGSLGGRVVVIDPGHNGGNAAAPERIARPVDAGHGRRKPCNTTGTATADGYPEHAQVWDVAQRLAPLLRSRGATVVLTRTSDTGVGPCVDERGRAGARAGADLLVSLHADGSQDTAARGFHVVHAPQMAGGRDVEAASAVLAGQVRDALSRGTSMPRAGYVGGGSGLDSRHDLAGLNLSAVPAVLVEGGNMRNPQDAALLRSPQHRQRQAEAVAAGVERFLARQPRAASGTSRE